jgi:mono/diheme cytochrome c family protein
MLKMKKVLKILKLTGLVILLLLVLLFAFVQFRSNVKFDAPYPDIKASADSAVIARGEYLVYGPAHCVSCHVPMDKMLDVDNGLTIPLSGGFEESVPGFGTFRAPNLTPDNKTGIGRLSDAEIARSLRHMISSDGRILFPFMEYQEMSDEDVTAIISFLRSQQAVNHEIKPTEYGFLAKALIAFGLFKAVGPAQTPPVSVKPDSTIAYGKYMAHDIGNCRSCHSKIDNSGKQIGADFAGGFLFAPTEWSEGYAFVSANITPHKTTGVIANWTEDVFMNRFRAGRIYERTPMPWGCYSRMTETDLKAVYRYLQSLEPVEMVVEKTLFEPGEQLPK